jgi:hypothetical protein
MQIYDTCMQLSTGPFCMLYTGGQGAAPLLQLLVVTPCFCQGFCEELVPAQSCYCCGAITW